MHFFQRREGNLAEHEALKVEHEALKVESEGKRSITAVLELRPEGSQYINLHQQRNQ